MSLFKRLRQSLRSPGPSTQSTALETKPSSRRRPATKPSLAPELIARCEEALTQRLQQAVREAYDLDAAAAFDYQAVRLGRFDPAWIDRKSVV